MGAVSLRSQADGSLLLAVKAVPGASRDRIVGPHGDALKVSVAAPPEAGKANAALCRLLAAALGVPPRSVTVHAGGGSPRKVLRLVGVSEPEARRRLGLE
ncbi:MAG: hypothetical protein BIFFINMI_04315 [Phycisphaerae bacterium]|nr:hypothetical protein [Phycisphaerae bacterium]